MVDCSTRRDGRNYFSVFIYRTFCVDFSHHLKINCSYLVHIDTSTKHIYIRTYWGLQVFFSPNIIFLVQVRLRTWSTMHPKFKPDWSLNSWPPDRDSTFNVTATPVLNTRPSVTSSFKTPFPVTMGNSQHEDVTLQLIFTASHETSHNLSEYIYLLFLSCG